MIVRIKQHKKIDKSSDDGILEFGFDFSVIQGMLNCIQESFMKGKALVGDDCLLFKEVTDLLGCNFIEIDDGFPSVGGELL